MCYAHVLYVSATCLFRVCTSSAIPTFVIIILFCSPIRPEFPPSPEIQGRLGSRYISDGVDACMHALDKLVIKLAKRVSLATGPE